MLTFAHYKNPAKISASLNEIKTARPCEAGWKQLENWLDTNGGYRLIDNKTQIDYRVFLESNGIRDTVWAWRCKWFE